LNLFHQILGFDFFFLWVFMIFFFFFFQQLCGFFTGKESKGGCGWGGGRVNINNGSSLHCERGKYAAIEIMNKLKTDMSSLPFFFFVFFHFLLLLLSPLFWFCLS